MAAVALERQRGGRDRLDYPILEREGELRESRMVANG